MAANALIVCASNQCDYCIAPHMAAAQISVTDAMLHGLTAVVSGELDQPLSGTLSVEIDEQFNL